MADDELIERLVKTVEGVASDVRTNSFKLDRLEEKLDGHVHRLEGKIEGVAEDLKLLSRQFKDVGGLVIKEHHPKIKSLEERVETLESEVH